MFSKDATVEIWMYIDVFDSPEDFKKMEVAINNMLESVPELKATFEVDIHPLAGGNGTRHRAPNPG